MRRVTAGLGRTLITAGVLILLFVVYQLWGTNFAERRSQAALLEEAPPPPQCDGQSTITNPDPPAVPEGEAVAVIKICKQGIGIEKAVVSGVSVEDLKKGPGHYPRTPLPGQPGNAAIAGHRTTYGAPFHNVDKLEPGDPILVSTAQGRFRYEVTELKIVQPHQVEVLDPSDDNRLTLTTCHPRFSAAQRLIVIAHLVGEAAPATPEPPAGSGGDGGGAGEGVGGGGGGDDGLAGEPGQDEEPVSFEEGLSGLRATATPAVGWGLIASSIWLFAWVIGRLWRRWPAYVIGTPIFLFVLYFFFEDFARLLPANV